eukprot:CAMPEP_0183356206 /NCGR_PEP_ID=MMETSP0164_2-20130417/43574_1 /TAXON_ID=221442 /ORGANISM="Coccolithus pelagicus ssp braarudi, Strain PLY182g" /LENGTH=40 /DNA_ID= /DNA_START= /DNA_END= /DNA_ORIENTATION=
MLSDLVPRDAPRTKGQGQATTASELPDWGSTLRRRPGGPA